MSPPEILLWQRLRGSPQGIAFRKQHPIDPYVADFYCAASRLVIEIDGKSHDMGDRPKRDDKKTAFLNERGYQILRIAALDVLEDPDSVAQSIVTYAAIPLHHRASRGDGQVRIAPRSEAMSGGHGDLPIPPRPGEDL